MYLSIYQTLVAVCACMCVCSIHGPVAPCFFSSACSKRFFFLENVMEISPQPLPLFLSPLMARRAFCCRPAPVLVPRPADRPADRTTMWKEVHRCASERSIVRGRVGGKHTTLFQKRMSCPSPLRLRDFFFYIPSQHHSVPECPVQAVHHATCILRVIFSNHEYAYNLFIIARAHAR